jgi:aryl-alcohol dehydrogenase-like predicted oxidoreductase
MGVGVLPWSPLARGRLARPPHSEDTARAEFDEFTRHLYDDASDGIVSAVGDVAERHHATRAQVALAWLLAKDAVTAPIIGATKLEHLDQAVAALDLELTEDDVAELEGRYEPRPVLGHG